MKRNELPDGEADYSGIMAGVALGCGVLIVLSAVSWVVAEMIFQEISKAFGW